MMLSTQLGGAETYFEKLSAAFAEAGVHQCLVIEPDKDRAELLGELPNTKVVQMGFGGMRKYLAPKRLRRVCSEFKPEIALTWMNRASRRAPTGFCPVVARLGGYYKLKHYQNCDHLIGITPDLINHLVTSGWPAENTSMIPNFGDTCWRDGGSPEGAELRKELGIADDQTVLLALGRLHRSKAHDVLLQAMTRVDGTTLLLAGEGPLREHLVGLAVELGIQDRVHFLGWRRDVAHLFDACDISVFPSRYEPNGTVVMESWANGKPLIAARAKGPEWLVEDGVNGLLFDINNVDQLSDRILELKSSPELSARLVEEGRCKFEASFSKDGVVASYLDLLRRLAKS